MSIASWADLPFGPSGPVCAMPKPILIGFLSCAVAGMANIAHPTSIAASAAKQAKVFDFRYRSMVVLPDLLSFYGSLGPFGPLSLVLSIDRKSVNRTAWWARFKPPRP